MYDVMGSIGEDPRWDVFSELHDYLSHAFPLTCATVGPPAFIVIFMTIFNSHAALSLTKVNTYGLVYAWHGSADTLKPLLLTAHQGPSEPDLCVYKTLTRTRYIDVVPVDPNNVVNWTYPPYSGYFDGARFLTLLSTKSLC